MIYLLFLLWWGFSIPGYLLVRYNYRKNIGKWTTHNRNFYLFGAALIGPILLGVHALIYYQEQDSKPSKW